MTACLTGYTLADLARLERSSVTCAHFFQRAPAMNPDRALITDKVCGVRVWDLLIRDIRYLGKLVGRAAQGTPMEQILMEKQVCPGASGLSETRGCFRLESPLLCRREGAAFSDALAVSGTVRADGHAVRISTPRCSRTKSTAAWTASQESRLQHRGPPTLPMLSRARAVI